MYLLLAKISARTISSIVITCIVVGLILSFLIVWLLWYKNKIHGNLDSFMYKFTNTIKGLNRQIGYKLRSNQSKKELALYWTVLSSGIISAILSFAIEICLKYYSLGLLRNIFFLVFLVFMISFNHRYPPTGAYYYEFNPTLFFYSAVSLFFALLDFFIGIDGTLKTAMLCLLPLVGNILFFGTIFFTRFAKTKFKPRDILVYVGAVIIIASNIVNFSLCITTNPLFIISNIFGLIYNIGIMVLLTLFYDGFYWLNRILRK